MFGRRLALPRVPLYLFYDLLAARVLSTSVALSCVCVEIFRDMQVFSD